MASKVKIIKGVNDLASQYPEVAMEWHPFKNGDKKPEDFTSGSGYKAWWRILYFDEERKQFFMFEWQAEVKSRTKKKNQCPYLTNHKIQTGFNDLATLRPDLASLWHKHKNGNLSPNNIGTTSKTNIWWCQLYFDDKQKKFFLFEWESSIYNQNRNKYNPILVGNQVYKGFNDLETWCIQNNKEYLLNEWHPTKNGNLNSQDVTPFSSKKVWWILPYDDPITGKHFDFEWQSTIDNRTLSNYGCPYLSSNAIYPGFNDFQTWCIQNNKEYLLNEWHPTKNGKLNPQNVTPFSSKKVWWLLSYDDPITGKHFDFEWQAQIADRSQDVGCPYLNGTSIWPGFNDFQTWCIQNNKEYLLNEWHPTKNGKLSPSDIAPFSSQKVWWFLPYDDSITGEHFDFEWKNTIAARAKDAGCPYLSRTSIHHGFNDFQTWCIQNNKEYLLNEWHPTKNGKLSPSDVAPFSNKKVWWFLPYDDPITGKHFDFEWKASIDNRTNGAQCPYLNSQLIWKGFNDLNTLFPEIAKEWHPTKNGKLTPNDVAPFSNKKVWWFLPYDDPITGKHFDFEWQSTIAHRCDGKQCPYLSKKNVGKFWPGFNDLETWCLQNNKRDLLDEWHHTKNGKLTPSNIVYGSHKKVWWYLSYDDPKTGKHFDFEWQASIANRVKNNSGCPFLNISKTEYFIHNLLKRTKIKFTVEEKFDDCKNKKSLPFDVYLPTYNLIIECDGQQHFEVVNHFGGKKKLNQTIKHDNIKNDYCNKNNIPLLRIPYIYDANKDKDTIEKFVLDFIETKSIPKEIKDFYKAIPFSNYAS